MNMHKTLIFAAVVLGTSGFSSCSMNKPGGGILSYHAYDRPAKLPQDPAAVTVKVSLSKQRAYLMEGREMLMVMPVSIGAPETPTPVGDFRITDKERKRREGGSANGSPLPYWCGFKPGLGFHTGWLKHHPCTNGCIRMHENLAPKFYRLVSIGTPVNISYAQPQDAQWAHMKLPPDAGPLPDYDSAMYLGDGYFHRHKEPEFE
ncbi:L,D-transpeptidase [Akkermansiaceae bacterium]|nr:L,D-transpeptidase [Akkermansiaceae bacterium]